MALVLLDRGLQDNVDASLQSVARTVAESVRAPSPLGADVDTLLESLLGPGVARRFFRLLDPLGRPDPRLEPRGQLPLTPEALRNAQQGRETFETFTLAAVPGAPVRVLTMPIVEQGRTIRVLQVAMSLQAADAARARFLLILLGLAPLALAGAAGGGWFLARRALAPVDAMVEAARRIEAEDLSRRIAGAGADDELARLGAVLNDMLARLERAFAAIRHFSADAAHELRTPLTILKGELEVTLRSSPAEDEYRRVLGSCLEEVDRLSALVEDLLFLARSEGGHVALPNIRVELTQVLADVMPALGTLADTAGVRVTTQATDGLWVRGSEPLLFRLIFNLGENAIKYTPAGGTVDIRLTADTARREAQLQVCDTGAGISSEDQAHIFDRFYRADPARSRRGTGLGLPLARSIALIHRGHIAVESAPGRGTCFRVTLPLSESQPPGCAPQPGSPGT